MAYCSIKRGKKRKKEALIEYSLMLLPFRESSSDGKEDIQEEEE